MARADSNELNATEVHEVLSNERRRSALMLLREAETSLSARDLSERIAEMETGESPPPRNIRQSAYVSLHQTHLPKLDELGVIEYDHSTKEIRLGPMADQVSVYMETVPRYGISWAEYYLGVSAVGLLLVVAATIGVPVLGAVDAAVWASLVFALIAVSAVYRLIEEGSSVLHRLRE